MATSDWTWQVLHHEQTGRPVNVLVTGAEPGVVLFSHKRRVWEVATGRAHARALTDPAEGVGRTSLVQRAAAEAAARQFGQTLPTEDELLTLLRSTPPSDPG